MVKIGVFGIILKYKKITKLNYIQYWNYYCGPKYFSSILGGKSEDITFNKENIDRLYLLLPHLNNKNVTNQRMFISLQALHPNGQK